jgi:hypothetical protein
VAVADDLHAVVTHVRSEGASSIATGVGTHTHARSSRAPRHVSLRQADDARDWGAISMRPTTEGWRRLRDSGSVTVTMAKRKKRQGPAIAENPARAPAADYDSPWKEALDRYFQAFLAFFFPEAHADIDWSRGYEMLDKELQQIVGAAGRRRRVVDKLAKVWLKTGEERWILVHVEVQTSREADFPRRMYV